MTNPIGFTPRPGQRVICPNCKKEGTYRPLSEGVGHVTHSRSSTTSDQHAVTSRACSVFGEDLGKLLPADSDTVEGVQVALQVHLLEERSVPRRSSGAEPSPRAPPAATPAEPLSVDEALETVEDALTMANLSLDEPSLRALARDPAASAAAGMLSALRLEMASVVQRTQQLRRVVLSLSAPRGERQAV